MNACGSGAVSGQWLPGIEATQALSAGVLAQLAASADPQSGYRANVVFFNPGAATSGDDNVFLVAKHSAQTLDNVWRDLKPVLPTSQMVAEAWCGVTYVPASAPGAGRLVVGGWFANPPNGADGFLTLYGDLGRSAPTRLETQVIGAPGRKADWILDHDVDRDGNVYADGTASGILGGTQRGEGEAFALELDPGSLAVVPARR